MRPGGVIRAICLSDGYAGCYNTRIFTFMGRCSVLSVAGDRESRGKESNIQVVSQFVSTKKSVDILSALFALSIKQTTAKKTIFLHIEYM